MKTTTDNFRPFTGHYRERVFLLAALTSPQLVKAWYSDEQPRRKSCSSSFRKTANTANQPSKGRDDHLKEQQQTKSNVNRARGGATEQKRGGGAEELLPQESYAPASWISRRCQSQLSIKYLCWFMMVMNMLVRNCAAHWCAFTMLTVWLYWRQFLIFSDMKWTLIAK